MTDALTDTENRLRSAGLTVRRDPSVYGEGLLAFESVEGPQGLTILNDAVFIFTDDVRWGAWWIGRDLERPNPQYDDLSHAVDEIIGNNEWSLTVR